MHLFKNSKSLMYIVDKIVASCGKIVVSCDKIVEAYVYTCTSLKSDVAILENIPCVQVPGRNR